MTLCECDPQNYTDAEVTWSNGSKHLKRTCNNCKKSKNVSRKTEEQKLHAVSKALSQKFGNSFYTRIEWLRLRYKVLAMYNHNCALCGSTDKPLHVDHIKPRSKYPGLELEISNLQILCWRCNKGKGADDDQDFRCVK